MSTQRAGQALLSSERTDWLTPPWFIRLVRKVGPIICDPATTNANPTGAAVVWTPDTAVCGLRAEWPRDGLVYANPPYGAHLSGPIEPDYEIFKKGVLVGIGRGWGEKIAAHDGEHLALVPVRTETVWWRRLFHSSDVVLFWASEEHGSRISFVHPETGVPAPQSNLASTVFYRGPNAALFAEVFGPHGTLVDPRVLG